MRVCCLLCASFLCAAFVLLLPSSPSSSPPPRFAASFSHRQAWVECTTTGDRGDDSLLSYPDDDGYKFAWMECRQGRPYHSTGDLTG